MLNYFRHSTTRTLQTTSTSSGLVELLDLLDFSVEIARVDGSEDVQLYDVTRNVTSWMNDAFVSQLRTLGYQDSYAEFDTVILLERQTRLLEEAPSRFFLRGLQETTATGSALLTAAYKGAALFTKNGAQTSVPMDVVQFIQQYAFTNTTGLAQILQANTAPGLGSDVVDVSAYSLESPPDTPDDESTMQLQMIIIIAVAVAVVALLFLIVAIVWAWKYDRRNREAYLASKRRADPTATESNSTLADSKKLAAAPVSEIGAYGRRVAQPEPTKSKKLTDEDVSTSLSQYYRAGLGQGTPYSGTSLIRSNSLNQFNDAASVSSMESYGYSLDGYASTAMPMDMPLSNRLHSTGLHDEEDEDDDDDTLGMDTHY